LFVELWPYNHAPRGYLNRTPCLTFTENNKFVDNITTTLISGTVETRHVVIQYFRGKLYFNPDNTNIKEQYIGTRITNHKKWIKKYVPGERKSCEWHWFKGNNDRLVFVWNEIETKPIVEPPSCKKTAKYVFDATDFPELRL
jgi:hypothetical protein